MSTPTTAPGAARPDLRRRPTLLMLRWSVLPTLVFAPLAAAVTVALADLATGVSVLVGALLSVLVFGLGIVAVRGLLAGPGQGAMAGAFGVLIAQLGLTVGALVLVDRSSWLDTLVLGVSFVVVGVLFQVGLAVGALRARVTLEPSAGRGGNVRRDVSGDAEVSEQ